MSRFYNTLYADDYYIDDLFLEHYGTKGQKWYHRYHQSYESKPTVSGKVGQEHGVLGKLRSLNYALTNNGQSAIGTGARSVLNTVTDNPALKDLGKTLQNEGRGLFDSGSKAFGELGRSMNKDVDDILSGSNKAFSGLIKNLTGNSNYDLKTNLSNMNKLKSNNIAPSKVTDQLKYILGVSTSQMPQGGNYRNLDYSNINKGLSSKYSQYLRAFGKSASRLKSNKTSDKNLSLNRDAIVKDVMRTLGTDGGMPKTSTEHKRFVNRIAKRLKRQKKYNNMNDSAGLGKLTKKYLNDYLGTNY